MRAWQRVKITTKGNKRMEYMLGLEKYNLVSRLQASSLDVLVDSIRTCWDSGELSDSIKADYDDSFLLGEKDKKLIQAVIKKNHTSTLEHVFYTFKIRRLPRYILQELMRHRIASPSVKSSRYTLKELKTAPSFMDAMGRADYETASKYVYLSGEPELDYIVVMMLEVLRQKVVTERWTNDVLKQIMPEAYLCDLNFSLNARSLTNLLDLRLDTTAHFLIQELARNVYDILPPAHLFLYETIAMKHNII